MKVRQGLGAAGLALAWLASQALMPATAGAAPRSAEAVPDQVPPPIVCIIEFSPPPQVDDVVVESMVNDFVVHSTGALACDTIANRIDGWMELRRDGIMVEASNFDVADASGVWVHLRTPCVSGAYQAVMTAHWTPVSGGAGTISAESPTVNITC